MAYSRTLNHFTSMQELATLWASSTSYVVNQLVINNNLLYRCLITHTSSGSFLTDLAAGNWAELGFVDVNISANDINWATGITFYKTITSNTAFTFSNVVNGKMITITVTNSGASDLTVSFPSAKVSGILPTVIAAGRTTIYTAFRTNNVTYMTAATDFI